MGHKRLIEEEAVIVQGNSGVALTNYVGVRGTLVMDYNNKILRLHDGQTSGGIVFQASTIAQLSAAATTAELVTAYNLLISGMRIARLMS